MFRMIGRLVYWFVNVFLVAATGGFWALWLAFIWFFKKLFGIGQ